MQEIKTDIKRALLSRVSYTSILIMIFAIGLGIGWKQLFPESAVEFGLMTYYHADILFKSLHSDVVLMAIPIICTLPYTMSTFAFTQEN